MIKYVEYNPDNWKAIVEMFNETLEGVKAECEEAAQKGGFKNRAIRMIRDFKRTMKNTQLIIEDDVFLSRPRKDCINAFITAVNRKVNTRPYFESEKPPVYDLGCEIGEYMMETMELISFQYNKRMEELQDRRHDVGVQIIE